MVNQNEQILVNFRQCGTEVVGWRVNGRSKLLCCDEGRVERIEVEGKHLYLTKEGELSLLKTCKATPHNQKHKIA
jgi:hypothetical protein